MDLQSVLEPHDLFISYWLEQDLLVLAGDCRGILNSQCLSPGRLRELTLQFERQVSQPEYFGVDIAGEYLPGNWPPLQQPGQSTRGLLETLAAQLISPEIERLLRSGLYQRLVLFPDGVLHTLPFHLLVEYRLGVPWQRILPEGILSASSASAYTYAVQKKRAQPPQQALFLVGDRMDSALVQEAEKTAAILPCPSRICASRKELEEFAPVADIVYIATHGSAPLAGSKGDWSLLFDGGALGIDDFYRERIRLKRGALVALSACSVGGLRPGPAHEMNGMLQAFFFAGAASVISARWPVLYECADAVFAGTLRNAYQQGHSLGAALAAALSTAAQRPDILEMMNGSQAAPFFWGPFAIFGCGSA